jgi:hypothetical protein
MQMFVTAPRNQLKLAVIMAIIKRTASAPEEFLDAGIFFMGLEDMGRRRDGLIRLGATRCMGI